MHHTQHPPTPPPLTIAMNHPSPGPVAPSCFPLTNCPALCASDEGNIDDKVGAAEIHIQGSVVDVGVEVGPDLVSIYPANSKSKVFCLKEHLACASSCIVCDCGAVVRKSGPSHAGE